MGDREVQYLVKYLRLLMDTSKYCKYYIYIYHTYNVKNAHIEYKQHVEIKEIRICIYFETDRNQTKCIICKNIFWSQHRGFVCYFASHHFHWSASQTDWLAGSSATSYMHMQEPHA